MYANKTDNMTLLCSQCKRGGGGHIFVNGSPQISNPCAVQQHSLVFNDAFGENWLTHSILTGLFFLISKGIGLET